jgi:hypothetical protein
VWALLTQKQRPGLAPPPKAAACGPPRKEVANGMIFKRQNHLYNAENVLNMYLLMRLWPALQR